MKEKKILSAVEAFIALPDAEKRRQTARFDRPFVTDESRPLTRAERAFWERAKRRPGRPRNGQGALRISVTVEKGLLALVDARAKKEGISRAELIAKGLVAMLAKRPRRVA
jgi:hypothetical protein